jgi:hypothetical protein
MKSNAVGSRGLLPRSQEDWFLSEERHKHDYTYQETSKNETYVAGKRGSINGGHTRRKILSNESL